MRLLKLTILTLLAVSCKESIEWKLPDEPARLVVQGGVTNEFKQHYVALTRSQGYYDQNDPAAVPGAVVTVTDEVTTYNFSELYPDYFPGLYLSEVNFEGVPGRRYEVSIVLASELDGRLNYSAEMELEPVFEIADLQYTLQIPAATIFNYESRVFFSVSMMNEPAGTGDFYLLNVIKNGVLLTDEVESGLVWDDRWFEGKTTINTGDFGFFEPINSGDTLVLEIQSINQEYYDFVNNLKLEVASKDPFGFIGSPANIEGNISDGALGFFLCTAVVRDTVIVE